MQSCLPWRAHRSRSPSRQLLEYPTYTPSMPRVSRSSPPHLQFQPRAFRLSSPGLPGCKVSRLPEVDQVPPAVVSEPDKGVVAARAANDGTQLPHLVDHRFPESTDPSASIAGVLCGGHLEGEDLSKGAGRSIAVQPEFIHSSLTSRCSE